MYDLIIFIDYDGTITTRDSLYGVLQLLVSREEFDIKHEALKNNETTLSKVLHEAIDNTPSTALTEIMDYIKTISLREGFDEFLLEMKKRDIPVVVLSGGLRPLVEAGMDSYQDLILDLYCVELDASDEYMKLYSPYDDGTELMKKTEVMGRYSYKKAICIGDSYSDMKMAMEGDIVFARDFLAEYLEKMDKFYYPWNDFFDIIDTINKIGQTENQPEIS